MDPYLHINATLNLPFKSFRNRGFKVRRHWTRLIEGVKSGHKGEPMKALLSLSLILVAVWVDEEDKCVPPKEVDINDGVGPKREARKGRVEAGKHSLDREEGREGFDLHILWVLVIQHVVDFDADTLVLTGRESFITIQRPNEKYTCG